uniref:Uncharacterized protein n=1 Tax=Arundo donax TaxID=35708 RepID=A0A0A9E809_ARUDO
MYMAELFRSYMQSIYISPYVGHPGWKILMKF